MRNMRRVLCAILLTQVTTAWALCSTNGEYGAADIIVDALIFRPIGAIGTLLGGATFLVATPFLGIASIPPPHDAVQKGSEMLVLQPADWTFNRPVGDCRAMGYDNW